MDDAKPEDLLFVVLQVDDVLDDQQGDGSQNPEDEQVVERVGVLLVDLQTDLVEDLLEDVETLLDDFHS